MEELSWQHILRQTFFYVIAADAKAGKLSSYSLSLWNKGREKEEEDEMNRNGENVSPIQVFTLFWNRGDKLASAICEQADCDRISVKAGNSN